MQATDLNLLPTLVALLEESSVTRAAGRLHLSVPATSRALERARRTFGDQLLVKQGRGLVPTPRAEALLPRLLETVRSIEAVLDRPDAFDSSTLRRGFVIRANEAVIAALGADLLTIVRNEAQHVAVRFDLEGIDDIDAVRNGTADLLIGSYSEAAPADVERQHLGTERLVGVLRADHPVRAMRPGLRTLARLDHIVVSRRGVARNQLDRSLADLGLGRRVVAVVPSFAAALAMTVGSDLCTVAPARLAATFSGPGGLRTFELPAGGARARIEQLFHRRVLDDPAHRWLRRGVERVAAALPGA